MVKGKKRKDPYQSFNFMIEIDGIAAAGFAECSGLSAEVETFEYREGGVNDYTHRFAGAAKYPPLVLRRGMTDSHELWNWHLEVAKGFVIRRNGTIHLLDGEGQPVKHWHFVRAYPVKWTGPELRAGTSSVAFESIELTHEGLISPGI
ncbi:MAG TPA: phage tail protein [Pyrinomonadaceae bacterium]|jgi:phage tail-like protein|nr:phage tail protein [Pyrinomonadaceae bacterium]